MPTTHADGTATAWTRLRVSPGSLAPVCRWLLAAVWLAAPPVFAAARISALFGNHMVLQRDVPVPVWGTASTGEQVTVSFAGQTNTCVAGPDGRWLVRLAPLSASAEPRTLSIATFSVGSPIAKSQSKIEDVVVGDVWICAGQSNMEFPLSKAQNSTQEVANANAPALRLFKSAWQVAVTPVSEAKGKWQLCTPATAAGFSAVAYCFGRTLSREIDCPVGLIQVACSWTPAEAWISREGLSADPAIKKDILDRWDAIIEEYPSRKVAYDRKVAEWLKLKAAAEAEKRPVPKGPALLQDTNFIHRACGLFNGGIAPLIPVAMRGVIWYQGETNDGRADQYRRLFPLLIQDWRRAWGQGAFPFLYVQVSTQGKEQTLPAIDPEWAADWAELRESQGAGLALTNTAMVVTIDLGDGEVHPANKQDVGKRLAMAARAVAYGQTVVYNSPAFESAAVEGGKLRLRFKDVGSGLVFHGAAPKGFTVAGKDGAFVAAEAALDGDSVLVWSGQVPQPAAARYAWGNNPPFSLFSKDGLPVSTFRTDDWPCHTTGKTRMFVDEDL